MAVMLFIFLCFAGMFVMFLYILRSQEKFQDYLRQELAQTKVLLHSMEHKLAVLSGDPSHDSRIEHNSTALTSLSMTEHKEVAHDSGLDLHFDPNERMIR
ncbi:MAG: hypothetical protein RRY29_01625 [Desulfovibrionaceae bacterium]